MTNLPGGENRVAYWLFVMAGRADKGGGGDRSVWRGLTRGEREAWRSDARELLDAYHDRLGITVPR